MNKDLFSRLSEAKTEAEKAWIITENLLNNLSPNLHSAVWAVAIPHWFNAEILAALRPELESQATQLYTDLQNLSFVEVFPERGHNIHELTRKLMLEHLWSQKPEEFFALSAKAVEYFNQGDTSEFQIECLYHLVIVDSKWKNNQLWNLAQQWINKFRLAEMEYLLRTLLEQIESNRATTPAKAEIHYWIGRTKFQLYQNTEALTRYEQALAFYREIGNRLGEANTLIAIGDVLQFLKRSQEALTRYEQALAFYREIGDRLGEANTLIAIGDVLQFLKRSQEALTRYEQALAFYREIGDRLGEANTLKAIGDVLQFLKRSQEALTRYEQALAFYREIGARLGEANTLKAIGDVLQFLKRSQEALTRYEQALAFYREIGARLGEANTLIAIGDVLQFLKRSQEALTRYEQALAFYREIGARLGEANTLIAIGDVLQFLKRSQEALTRYEQALAFYREIGDRLGEANVLQGFGKLQDNPTQALEYFRKAQNLYIQIGDIYSQSRNLLYFIADVQLKMGLQSEAITSLNQGAELAASIAYQPLQEYAQNKIAEIESSGFSSEWDQEVE